MKKTLLLCALMALLLRPAGALAQWHALDNETLRATDLLVCEYTGEITVSFLGDCTLGGESAAARSSGGFVSTARREGFSYPFSNLLPLFQADDITVVNLEGVLSDRKLDKVKKEYNFKGPSAFAQILLLGGVELAGLSNNHTMDYGKEGYDDTLEALKQAGVMSFDASNAAIWERDGLRIGFTGSAFSLSSKAKQSLAEQMSALREAGCQLIIHVMHAGTEYRYKPSAQQRAVARTAIELGADLVVGHHPHVVQGYELIDGIPVVYSLGNGVFGGNRNPRDYDALLLQAVFAFSNGQAESMRLIFRPIGVSGSAEANNYQPVLLTGEDAQRVLDKMESSTGVEIPAFDTNEGARTQWFPLP